MYKMARGRELPAARVGRHLTRAVLIILAVVVLGKAAVRELMDMDLLTIRLRLITAVLVLKALRGVLKAGLKEVKIVRKAVRVFRLQPCL